MPQLNKIDIAHPPLDSGEAEAMLDSHLRKASLASGIYIISVIHGYGSSGKGGTLKTVVRNWAYRNRRRIKMILPGEETGLFDPPAQELLRETGLSAGDIGPPGEGHTIIWIR